MSHSNTDQQQLRAIAAGRPCIVRASAGSGKTKVLTEHYLELITSGRCSVTSIVSLTFTRKAAAEMYQRIFHLLIEESAVQPNLEQQIEDFADATITTLDGYCLRIVRSAETLFPFKSEPRIDPIGYEELLEHTAFRTLQAHAKGGGFPWANESHTGALRSLLNNLLIFLDRTHLPCTILLDTAKMIALQKQYLLHHSAICNEELLTARACALSCSEAHGLQRHIAELAPPSATDAALADVPLKETERVLLNQYVSLNLRRVNRNADDAGVLKEAARQLRATAKQLVAIDDYRRSLTDHDAIYQLMIDFQRRLNIQKMRHGLFNYNNILELAIVALSTDNALCSYLRRCVQAILVDEFQDNNILQKNLLYLLAGAEATDLHNPFAEIPFPTSSLTHLFLVGDDKQSIYRFRGANVHLFNAMYQQFKEHGGEQIELMTNYRTHSDLLQRVNDICSAVFAEDAADAHPTTANSPANAIDGSPLTSRLSAIRYHPFGAYWQTDHEYASRAAPFLSLDYYPIGEDESSASSAQREAAGITETIMRFMADAQPIIFDTGRYRTAQYDDFAILFRTRTHSAVIEQALRERGVPYRSDGTAVLDDSPAHDLYTLLFLALYPQSSYHYASVLRSPWANCSDEAIQIIISELRLVNGSAFAIADIMPSRGDQSIAALDAHLATMSEMLDDGDYRKYHHAARLFHQLRQRMIHASAAEIVNFLWYGWGYYYWLISVPQARQQSELYDALQQLAVQSNDLYRFFVALERALAEKSFWRERNAVNDDSAGYLSADRGVHLLTIHKAKGLEFPVVFLAQSGAGARGADKTPIVYDDELGYSIKTAAGNALFDLRKSDREYNDAEELKRLLYVAMTRAQSHLFISAHDQKKNTTKQTLWDLVTQSKVLTPCIHDSAELLSVPAATVPPLAPVSIDELRRRIEIPAATIESTVTHVSATAFTEVVYAAMEHSSELRRQMNDHTQASPMPFASSIPLTPAHSSIASVAEASLHSDAPPHAGALPYPLAIDAVPEIDHKQFGTLCHRLLAEIVGVRLPPQHALDDVFLSQLTATHYLSADHNHACQRALIDSLRSVVQCFFSSTLYDWVTKGSMRTFCERPFVLLQEIGDVRYLIHGIVDLLCIDDVQKSVYIIDYKSDQVVDKQRYIGQLGCYLSAVERLYNYPAQAILYGIRSGECCSVSTEYALRVVQEPRYYQELSADMSPAAIDSSYYQ